MRRRTCGLVACWNSIGAIDDGLEPIVIFVQIRIGELVVRRIVTRVMAIDEPVARPADRESLLVKKFANPPDQQHLMVLVIAPIAAPLHRLELGEFLLPVAQHIRLDAAQLAYLADREVAFGGDRRKRFLHKNQ